MSWIVGSSSDSLKKIRIEFSDFPLGDSHKKVVTDESAEFHLGRRVGYHLRRVRKNLCGESGWSDKLQES